MARERQELAWFDAVRTSDERAFESLFRAYFESLSAFAYSYVESREIAQDLVQELFFRLWDRRLTLELPRNVNAYLYGATRNAAVSHLRSRRAESVFLDRARNEEDVRDATVEPLPVEDALEAEALAGAVDRALAELPPRCREVFVLTRNQHLSYAEAAAVLGISPKTVEIHMGRALGFLRQKLRRWLAIDRDQA